MNYFADVRALARKDLLLELRARDTLPAMLLRGAARHNQRPDANFEQRFGEKAVLNGRLGSPQHTGRQGVLQQLVPSFLRHDLFSPLRFLRTLLRHVHCHDRLPQRFGLCI
jgi:hypothetical protein